MFKQLDPFDMFNIVVIITLVGIIIAAAIFVNIQADTIFFLMNDEDVSRPFLFLSLFFRVMHVEFCIGVLYIVDFYMKHYILWLLFGLNCGKVQI